MTKPPDEIVLSRVPRDVLAMLQVELRNAKRGMAELIDRQRPGPVDQGYVEMLEEIIAEVTRLRSLIRKDPTP